MESTSKELFEIASQTLKYDPESGEFFWKTSRGKAKAGNRIGWKCTNGYIYFAIRGRKYTAHRIAWLISHGSFPAGDIDHINGVRDDNKLSNLRVATRSENLQNTRCPNSRNTSGYMGITFHKQSGRWNSRICTNGIVKSLGYFDLKEDAAKAYLEAKRADHSFCTI